MERLSKMHLRRGQLVVIYTIAIMAGLIGAFFLPLPGRYTNSGQSGTPSPKLTGPVAICTTNDVRIGLDPDNSATGHRYYSLVFVNTSDKTCTLSGYPKLTLVDKNAQILGSPAVQATFPSSTVMLSGGDAAHAIIDFPVAANFPTGTCSAAASALNVYLPGQTSILTVVTDQPACPGWSVQPFKSGIN